MEINPNRPVQKITRSQPKKGPAATRKAEASQPASSESVSGLSFTKLEDRFLELSEVRQERVEDGRRLTRDPNYPDSDQLRQIGRLLAEERPETGK